MFKTSATLNRYFDFEESMRNVSGLCRMIMIKMTSIPPNSSYLFIFSSTTSDVSET